MRVSFRVEVLCFMGYNRAERSDYKFLIQGNWNVSIYWCYIADNWLHFEIASGS